MFKKSLAVLGLLVFLPLVRAKAAYDLESTLRDKTITVTSTFTVAANTTASTNTILVSLSSATWPHTDRGTIHITNIQLTVDKVAASSGSIKMGVITYVDQSSGTATYFMEKSFQKNVSGTDNTINFNLDNANLRTDVIPAANQAAAAGSTPFILSNDLVTLSSTTFNKATKLPSVNGNLAPGTGDVFLTITNNDFTNAMNIITTVQYHSHPR